MVKHSLCPFQFSDFLEILILHKHYSKHQTKSCYLKHQKLSFVQNISEENNGVFIKTADTRKSIFKARKLICYHIRPCNNNILTSCIKYFYVCSLIINHKIVLYVKIFNGWIVAFLKYLVFIVFEEH